VIDRLREKGAAEEQLKKIHAPIGLDIGAISPEEVALAIIAEIVAARRGASGGSLSAWRRKS
jgi:xanthine dehydrogenase accessory factor